MLTIDIDTARRFILGKQGLWPGRRQRGIQGMEPAGGVTKEQGIFRRTGSAEVGDSGG